VAWVFDSFSHCLWPVEAITILNFFFSSFLLALCYLHSSPPLFSPFPVLYHFFLLPLPCSFFPVLFSLQADERFFMQYADVSRSRQELAAAYRTRLVQPVDLEVGTQVLGAGRYGTVSLGSLRQSRLESAWRAPDGGALPVAIKSVLIADDAALTQILLEARLLSVMSHPHVVRLLAVSEAYQPVLLAMELCEGGDLLTRLRCSQSGDRTQSGVIWGPAELIDLAAQMASGLAYLHTMLCVHRDLAARNVLVGKPEGHVGPSGVQLKLGDLGMARGLGSATSTSVDGRGGAGTAEYYKVGAEAGRAGMIRRATWCVLLRTNRVFVLS
jgi:hypothetical protein